jgi:hypothetical protein
MVFIFFISFNVIYLLATIISLIFRGDLHSPRGLCKIWVKDLLKVIHRSLQQLVFSVVDSPTLNIRTTVQADGSANTKLFKFNLMHVIIVLFYAHQCRADILTLCISILEQTLNVCKFWPTVQQYACALDKLEKTIARVLSTSLEGTYLHEADVLLPGQQPTHDQRVRRVEVGNELARQRLELDADVKARAVTFQLVPELVGHVLKCTAIHLETSTGR